MLHVYQDAFRLSHVSTFSLADSRPHSPAETSVSVSNECTVSGSRASDRLLQMTKFARRAECFQKQSVNRQTRNEKADCKCMSENKSTNKLNHGEDNNRVTESMRSHLHRFRIVIAKEITKVLHELRQHVQHAFSTIVRGRMKGRMGRKMRKRRKRKRNAFLLPLRKLLHFTEPGH